MSSFNRRTMLLAPLALAACGFRPIYGRGTAAEALLGRIQLGPVDDRLSFEFHEHLEDRIGRAVDPIYRLDVQITMESTGLAITQDNAITRYNMTAKASFSLIRLSDGQTVLSDTLHSFTAYSATASAYATHISERDATRRLAVALAEQIVTRIAASAESFSQ